MRFVRCRIGKLVEYCVYDGNFLVGRVYRRPFGGWLFSPSMSADCTVGRTRLSAVLKCYSPSPEGENK